MSHYQFSFQVHHDKVHKKHIEERERAPKEEVEGHEL